MLLADARRDDAYLALTHALERSRSSGDQRLAEAAGLHLAALRWAFRANPADLDAAISLARESVESAEARSDANSGALARALWAAMLAGSGRGKDAEEALKPGGAPHRPEYAAVGRLALAAAAAIAASAAHAAAAAVWSAAGSGGVTARFGGGNVTVGRTAASARRRARRRRRPSAPRTPPCSARSGRASRRGRGGGGPLAPGAAAAALAGRGGGGRLGLAHQPGSARIHASVSMSVRPNARAVAPLQTGSGAHALGTEGGQPEARRPLAGAAGGGGVERGRGRRWRARRRWSCAARRCLRASATRCSTTPASRSARRRGASSPRDPAPPPATSCPSCPPREGDPTPLAPAQLPAAWPALGPAGAAAAQLAVEAARAAAAAALAREREAAARRGGKGKRARVVAAGKTEALVLQLPAEAAAAAQHREAGPASARGAAGGGAAELTPAEARRITACSPPAPPPSRATRAAPPAPCAPSSPRPASAGGAPGGGGGGGGGAGVPEGGARGIEAAARGYRALSDHTAANRLAALAHRLDPRLAAQAAAVAEPAPTELEGAPKLELAAAPGPPRARSPPGAVPAVRMVAVAGGKEPAAAGGEAAPDSGRPDPASLPVEEA
eukprot:tig00020816_g14105.t1